MRAIICKVYGPPELLVVEEVPSLVPGLGEVVVDVHACGIQFVDNRVINGSSLLNTGKLDHHYGRRMQLEPPMIPGMEAAGVVKAVGQGVRSVAVGDRVLGLCLVGGLAEEVCFEEKEVRRIPDEMDFKTAACFFLPAFVAHYSLVIRANLREGETLLVLGAGSGVGLATIDVAKAIGATVVAAASSEEKLAAARQHGADVLVQYAADALDLKAQKSLSARFKEAGGDRGINVVSDFVGGTYAEPAMRALAFGARYLSIGFSAGIPSIPMHVIFNKNGCLIGIEPASGYDERVPGNYPGAEQLFEWYRAKKLRPHIADVLPLERAGEGLRRLLDRKVTGRIVLTTRNMS